MKCNDLPTDVPSEFFTPRVIVPPVFYPVGECPPVVEMSSLWSRFSNMELRLKSPDFLGEESRFYFFTPDGWIPLWASFKPKRFDKAIYDYTRDRVIAAANFIYIRDQLCGLAKRIRTPTTPTPKALQHLIFAATGNMIVPEMSVDEMESQRQSAIKILSSPIQSFLASIIAASPARKKRTVDVQKRAAIEAELDQGITQQKIIQRNVKAKLHHKTNVSPKMIAEVKRGWQAKPT